MLRWQVPLVEQELLTLLEHLSSPPVFSGVRVTRSLILYVCSVDHCLSFCNFSFEHCVVCSPLYRFWLPPFGIFKLFLNSDWCLSSSIGHMLLGHIIHTLHMESSYVLSREVASYKCSKTLFGIKREYNQNLLDDNYYTMDVVYSRSHNHSTITPWM